MFYSINREKLNKLINISDMNLSSHQVITNEEIDVSIMSPEKNNDILKKESLERIKYLIVNPEELYVDLYMRDNKLETTHPLDLIASLYPNKEDIIIEVKDEETLLFLGLENSKEIQQINKKRYVFNWDDIVNLTDDTWGNDSFIMEKVKACTSFRDEGNEIFKFVPVEKWSDIAFIDKILKSLEIKNTHYSSYTNLNEEFIENMPLKFFETIPVLEYAINTKNKKMLLRFYSIYNSFKRTKEKITNNGYYSDDNQSFLGNYYKIIKNIDEEKRVQLVNEELCIKAMEEKLLDSIDMAILYLDSSINNRCVDHDYLLYFTNKVRKDKTVINKLIDQMISSSYSVYNDLSKLLEQSVLDDSKIQEKLIKNMEKFEDDNYIEKLANNWIKNKEKVIYYGNLFIESYDDKSKKFDVFWKFLEKDLKEDVDVAKIFITINHKLYNKVAQSIRDDKSVFLIYCKSPKGEHKITKISQQLLDSLNKEELTLAITKMPELYYLPIFPTQYHQDPEILVAMLRHDKFKLSDEKMKELFEDTALAIKAIEINTEYYNEMAPHKKINIDIALKYLKLSYREESMPNELFLSKKICLEYINKYSYGINAEQILKIPQQYFSDQDFISDLLLKIDKKELNINILNLINSKFSECINKYSLKEGDLYPFFNKMFMNNRLENKLNEDVEVKPIKKNKL